VRVEELLARLAGGENRGGDPPPNLWKEQALLADLAQCMRDASICGLGQTATSAIESAMAKLPLWVGRDTPGGAA
jgi:NADH-quinone oxidoreductase subunit F